jgi:hypothetical protein
MTRKHYVEAVTFAVHHGETDGIVVIARAVMGMGFEARWGGNEPAGGFVSRALQAEVREFYVMGRRNPATFVIRFTAGEAPVWERLR